MEIENQNNDKQKKKHKKVNPVKAGVLEGIRKMIMCAALCVFTYSAYELTNIYLDYQEGDESYENMEDKIFVPVIAMDAEEPETDIQGNIISNGNEEKEFKFDFDALLQINGAAQGWIKQEGTLSYPIVQGGDDDYYLYHNVAHQSNKSGSIFLDFRNEGGLEARNCVIYGHNMLNGSMFGTLINYETEEYYKQHPTFDVYVGYKKYRYYVFAAYETDQVGSTYTFTFPKDEDFQEYIDACWARKYYSTAVEKVTVQDKIITLSTCTKNNPTKRFIVQMIRGEEIIDQPEGEVTEGEAAEG